MSKVRTNNGKASEAETTSPVSTLKSSLRSSMRCFFNGDTKGTKGVVGGCFQNVMGKKEWKRRTRAPRQDHSAGQGLGFLRKLAAMARRNHTVMGNDKLHHISLYTTAVSSTDFEMEETDVSTRENQLRVARVRNPRVQRDFFGDDQVVHMRSFHRASLKEEKRQHELKAHCEFGFLNHVARPYVFFLDRNFLHLAMERVMGRDLTWVMSQDGPLGEKTGLRLMCQILNILTLMHGEGCALLDLRPCRIHVEDDFEKDGSYFPHAKIFDFGNVWYPKSRQGVYRKECRKKSVSQPYAAPETGSRSGAYSAARADIWMAGVVLYEMISGYRPFDGNTSAQVRREARHGVDIFGYNRWLVVNPHTKSLLRRCLSLCPRKRPSAAQCFEATADILHSFDRT